MRTPPVPMAVALEALAGPDYEADLTRRAEKWADELRAKSGPGPRHVGTDFYAHIGFMAPLEADKARASMRFDRFGTITAAERTAAAEETNRRYHAMVVRELKVHLRAADVSAIRNEPERMAWVREMNEYSVRVGAWAWSQGNKEAEAVGKWQRLMAARAEAVEDEDEREVDRIDARLLALTSVPHPHATPVTNGNGAGKRLARRNLTHTSN